jgi:hypothetical protein
MKVEHGLRYRRAAEFVAAVRTLWNSREPRSPQGEPVIVQAGGVERPSRAGGRRRRGDLHSRPDDHGSPKEGDSGGWSRIRRSSISTRSEKIQLSDSGV